jgi:hypothetical protein
MLLQKVKFHLRVAIISCGVYIRHVRRQLNKGKSVYAVNLCLVCTHDDKPLGRGFEGNSCTRHFYRVKIRPKWAASEGLMSMFRSILAPECNSLALGNILVGVGLFEGLTDKSLSRFIATPGLKQETFIQ